MAIGLTYSDGVELIRVTSSNDLSNFFTIMLSYIDGSQLQQNFVTIPPI